MKKNKKKLVVLGIIGVLIGLTSMIIGLYIGCMHTDHTKEICPITRLLSVIYYVYPEAKGLGAHQVKSMLIAYDKTSKEIDNVSYGEIIEPVYKVKTADAIVNSDETGQIYYEAPEGYTLLSDGKAEKKIKIGEQFRGLYGVTTYFKDGTTEELVIMDYSK